MVFVSKTFDELGVSGVSLEQYLEACMINRSAYERISNSYAAVTMQHVKAERENIDSAMMVLREQRGVIVDYGCGFGRDSGYWVQKRMQYYGLDDSEAMIKVAREKNMPGEYFHGDMLRTTLEPNSTLIVWASSCLQHVPSCVLPIVLDHAVTGLKRGGIFYANYRPPKEGYPKEGIVESGEYADNETGEKVRIKRFIAHYSQQEMSSMLESFGLEVLQASEYEEIYSQYDKEKGEYLPTKEIIFARKK